MQNLTIYTVLLLSFILLPYAIFATSPVALEKLSADTEIKELAGASIPECTRLTYPRNGQENVPLSIILRWEPVEGATGYRIEVGNAQSTATIFYEASFDTNASGIFQLNTNRSYYVRIFPFNEEGEAIGCIQESFSSVVACIFYDEVFEETVNVKPEINVPERLSLCKSELPFTLSSTDRADGFRWYKINPDGTPQLISESREVELTEAGNYLFELFDEVVYYNTIIECPNSQEFVVEVDVGPVIISATGTSVPGGLTITITVEGSGVFEYGLNNSEGPYQRSNIFEMLPFQEYTVYVREIDGCGFSEKLVQIDISEKNFPKFFTPNGDGVNDFWRFERTSDLLNVDLGPIAIYDRYGGLILMIDSMSNGWDGTMNGKPLPAADYWYSASLAVGYDIKGHFSLKR